jgi:peroxiredoxin
MRLVPRQPVPALSLDTVGGRRFVLGDEPPQHFTMLVFYRGLHCPICRRYLTELNGLVGEFSARGVQVVAASGDIRDRAQAAVSEWGLTSLTVGYGLSTEVARSWSLFISTSRGKTSIGIEEPALFSEPGLFLVRPDGTLYWSNVSTMPFARPHFSEILTSIDFALKQDYPARGEA